ncbi:MAG: LysR family transcriptional regulator substrate-binding protein, partial [Rhodospirillales bacterium]|nr:LysR family transcriptional regulator substrate-binding protein [Rhodospirillales bacterium]
PGVKVSVTIGNSQDMLDALLSFRVDVAVLAQPQDDPRFFAMTYRDHPVIAMVNRAHPWAKRKSVRMENFEGQKMIFREEGSTTRSAFETALNAAGVTPKVVMEIGSREGIWGAVVRGIGISVVSEAELVPHEKIHTLRITGADIVTSAHVVCMAERQKSRLIGAFLGVAHDLSASGKGKRRKRMVL